VATIARLGSNFPISVSRVICNPGSRLEGRLGGIIDMCTMKICAILTASWCGNSFMHSKQGLLKRGKKANVWKGCGEDGSRRARGDGSN